MSIPGHHQPFPVSRFPTGNAGPGGNAKPKAGAGFTRSRPKPFRMGVGTRKPSNGATFPVPGDSSLKSRG